MISITIVLVIIGTVLPVVLRSGSIFSTAIISVYMTYLCYDGLSHYPKSSCNPTLNQRSTASLWIGIILTAWSITYAGLSVPDTFSSKPTTEVELKVTEKATVEVDADQNDTVINESNYNDVEEKVTTTSPSDAEKEKAEQRSNVLFHVCMAFAAVYMSMLYTNWGTNTNSSITAATRGMTTYWVNMAAEWTAFALYLWVILAPKVCPGRFGVQSDDD